VEDNKLNAAKQSKPQLPIAWLILFFTLLVLMLFVFYAGTQPSNYKSQADLDGETCAGLDGPQCLEKLQLERRRREFVESPDGQEFLRAAEATTN
jgi:hypothetical protein